jgi:predicted RNase H-like HicB family nuclease
VVKKTPTFKTDGDIPNAETVAAIEELEAGAGRVRHGTGRQIIKAILHDERTRSMAHKIEPAVILKKSYTRTVVPEADGSFTAEILEFPGCVASGDTAAEALANIEDVALDWIAAVLEQGQNIPDPLDQANYNGKLVVRMTKGLHQRAAHIAEREGVSLNQFIVTCIAEQVGTRATMDVRRQAIQRMADEAQALKLP